MADLGNYHVYDSKVLFCALGYPWLLPLNDVMHLCAHDHFKHTMYPMDYTTLKGYNGATGGGRVLHVVGVPSVIAH